MKLEEITAELRPRTQWESIDLGVALTRRHFKNLIAVWLLTVLPIWAVCIFLLRDHPFWCLTLIIFLRPVYDRPILFYFSRALFNAPPRVLEVLKGWPKIVAPGLITGLTIGRFSLARSLLMPLHVLEGVKPRQYRARRSAILRSGGSAGSWLTFVCVFLELILVMGFVFLIIAFIPPHVAPDWDEMFARFFTPYGFSDGLPAKLAWFAIGTLLVAMSFVEIFYVGCGFALYLNSRSHVEGWDIEITFRRLATKLSSATGSALALVIAAALLFSAPAAHAQGAPSRDEVKEELREVLADDDFIIHEGTRRVRVSSSSNSDIDVPDFSFFAALGEFLFWSVLVAAVAALAWLAYMNRHLFTGRPTAPAEEEEIRRRTRTVMGLDIASDTLPDDIPGAALAAWRNGDAQLATSLLYRGAICWLVEAAKLPLLDSDTERDCVQHTRALGDASQREYFSGLTSQWISTAYNEVPPTDSVMEQMCATWPFDLRKSAP
jgi:hypothetical protein